MTDTISEDLRLAIHRTFTTESRSRVKRGHHVIRERCIQFVQRLKGDGHLFMQLDRAKDLFSMTVDCWDRTTLKAYFGTQPDQSERVIQRTASYASTGTISHKTIRLRQKVKEKKGYLERLGLVEINRLNGEWCVFVNDVDVVPEVAFLNQSVNGACGVSNVNFSLAPNGSLDNVQQPLEVSHVVTKLENSDVGREERECYRVREKNHWKSTPTQKVKP